MGPDRSHHFSFHSHMNTKILAITLLSLVAFSSSFKSGIDGLPSEYIEQVDVDDSDAVSDQEADLVTEKSAPRNHKAAKKAVAPVAKPVVKKAIKKNKASVQV